MYIYIYIYTYIYIYIRAHVYVLQHGLLIENDGAKHLHSSGRTPLPKILATDPVTARAAKCLGSFRDRVVGDVVLQLGATRDEISLLGQIDHTLCHVMILLRLTIDDDHANVRLPCTLAWWSPLGFRRRPPENRNHDMAN